MLVAANVIKAIAMIAHNNIQVHRKKLECSGKVHLFQ